MAPLKKKRGTPNAIIDYIDSGNATATHINLGHKFLFEYRGAAANLLRITPHVVEIGQDFMFGASNLEAFDTVGLTQVHYLANNFLRGATQLRVFNSQGLTSVVRIDDNFLGHTPSLRMFEGQGFSSLSTIANAFLVHTGLQAFSIQGMGNVRTIGEGFLYDAHSLNTFDSSGFDHLEWIGTHALASTTQLPHVARIDLYKKIRDTLQYTYPSDPFYENISTIVGSFLEATDLGSLQGLNKGQRGVEWTRYTRSLKDRQLHLLFTNEDHRTYYYNYILDQILPNVKQLDVTILKNHFPPQQLDSLVTALQGMTGLTHLDLRDNALGTLPAFQLPNSIPY